LNEENERLKVENKEVIQWKNHYSDEITKLREEFDANKKEL